MEMIKANTELQSFLHGKIKVVDGEGATVSVPVYLEHNVPEKDLPENFILISYEGEFESVDTSYSFFQGLASLELYVKLNPDGSMKENRIEKLSAQFRDSLKNVITPNYVFNYIPITFSAPSSAYKSIGYSVSTFNLKWHTK